MWATLIGLISPALALTDKIVAWQAKKIDAKTEQERIEADENIKALQAKRDVLIAESRTPINAIARFILMFPFALIMWQYIVWDKIVCKRFYPEIQCTTDNLSPDMWHLCMVVYGFYFVSEVARRFGK